MKMYNQIMSYFWLFSAITIFLIVTYMSLMEGFNKWAYYYIFVLTSLGVYFLKTWMMKRMVRHNEFLKEKNTVK
jgi:hypothetical protein